MDTLALEKPSGNCAPMALALYTSADNRLVFHRALKLRARRYLICGDNCVSIENVDKGDVPAGPRGLPRCEREIKLDSCIYRRYVLLWRRPYHLCIFIQKVRNRLKRMAGKMRRRAAHVLGAAKT